MLGYYFGNLYNHAFWSERTSRRRKEKKEIASKTIRYFAGTGHGPTFVFSETSYILAELYPNFSYTTFETEKSGLIELSFIFQKGQGKRFFIRKEDLATLELIKRLSVK
ncbi:MAG: hypothetical protein PHX25_01010 [Candidatus Pacebacteria bacterium]|nr:hypothetical protein [Candidatus Paceibacterota bacterium]